MLVVLVLLGGVDLALTWATMTSGGLFEDNYIVRRLLAAVPSAGALFAFKIILSCFGVATFWIARRRAWVQLACAGCVAAYLVVLMHWVLYVRVVNQTFAERPSAMTESSLVRLD